MSGLSLGLNLGLARVSGKGGPPAKTYADFAAYIATLATGGTQGFGANLIAVPSGKYRTTAGGTGGDLLGTPWLSYFGDFGTLGLAIRHGLPSAAEYTAQTSAGRIIYFELVRIADQVNFVGIARNGLTSQSYNDGNPNGAFQMVDLIYWDGTQAMQMNPSTGTGPTPYPIP